jgi:hypothetical protein
MLYMCVRDMFGVTSLPWESELCCICALEVLNLPVFTIDILDFGCILTMW